MIVVPFIPLHLNFTPQAEQAEMYNLMPEYLDFYNNGDAYTGVVDGEVIGCAGFIPTPLGLMVWAMLSDKARLHLKAITKSVLTEFRKRGELVALVRDGFSEGIRWAGLLGFRDTGEVYENTEGQNCKLFVRQNGSG